MISQLLLSKRLFAEGSSFARRNDSVSAGVATSLFQDSVELFVWAVIKEKGITVRETSALVDNLNTLASKGFELSDRSKVLELNKARVGFKHYGNLPAPGEAVKFQTYAEDFLRGGMKDMFGVNFDALSMSDLVAFTEVREVLKEAERLLAESAPPAQVALKLALAKGSLFGRIARYIPQVDRNLHLQDRALRSATDGGAFSGFTYVRDYLTMLRDLCVVTLMQVPLEDYTFLTSRLPVVHGNGGQIVQTRSAPATLSLDDCRRIIEIIVGICIRLEGALQAR